MSQNDGGVASLPTGENSEPKGDEPEVDNGNDKSENLTDGKEDENKNTAEKEAREAELWDPLKEAGQHVIHARLLFGETRANKILALIKEELIDGPQVNDKSKLLDFPSMAEFAYQKLYVETGLVKREVITIVINLLSRLYGCFDHITSGCQNTAPTMQGFRGLSDKLVNLIIVCCIVLSERYKRRDMPYFNLPGSSGQSTSPVKLTIQGIGEIQNKNRQIFDAFLLMMLASLREHLEEWKDSIKKVVSTPQKTRRGKANAMVNRNPKIVSRPKINIEDVFWKTCTSFCGTFSVRLNKKPIEWNIDGVLCYPIALTMLGIYPNSNQRHKIGNKRKQKQGSPQIPEGSQYESGYETALEFQEHTVLRDDIVPA